MGMLLSRWVEQEAGRLVGSVRECLEEVGGRLGEEGRGRLKGIGITNQRETTIVWDRATGTPLHRTIGEWNCGNGDVLICSLYLSAVWNDVRAAELAEKLIERTSTKSRDHYKV